MAPLYADVRAYCSHVKMYCKKAPLLSSHPRLFIHSNPHLCLKDLSTCHDWPVKKAIISSPIRMKGNSKRTSGDSLSPLAAQNKDLCAASQTLLTGVKLRLQRRLPLPYPGYVETLLTGAI